MKEENSEGGTVFLFTSLAYGPHDVNSIVLLGGVFDFSASTLLFVREEMPGATFGGPIGAL